MSEVLNWINKKIITDKNNKLTNKDIENIKDFSLLWNLFEDLFWVKNSNNINHSVFHINEALEIIDSKKDQFDECVIDSIFDYFYTRYQDSSKFKNLNFREYRKKEKEVKEKLEKMLSSSIEYSKSDKLYFIMAIIFRYRNNLFHGEKQLIKIKYQEINFLYANKFLIHIIESSLKN